MASPITKGDATITRGEVDGVPVFSTSSEGPLTAALVFRVGRIDESLATNGITHLIEHLALSTVGQQAYQYNGFVEGLLTVFTVSGTEREVVDFFQRVTAALATLPLDRLEHESRVLHTEQASRNTGPMDSLLALRFGSTGWGLTGNQEYGLHSGAARVDRWRAETFTRQNAAFWINAAPPDGLRLELPAGARRAVPQLAATPFPLPAWTAMRSPGVGMSMLAERSTQLTAALHIAERRARARLRYEEGVSYEVAVSYLRLDATTAHVTLWADALPDNAPQVRDGLLAVVEDLIGGGPGEDEIKTELEVAEKMLDAPGRAPVRLHGEVARELYGAPRPERNEILRELRESSPDQIAGALRQAIPTALVIVPEGLSVTSPRFQPVPEWSTERFKGRTIKLRGQASSRPLRLTLAAEGVMLTLGKNKIVTLPYSRCAAVLTWNDGSRTLMGEDGSRMHLRPADWRKGEKAIQEIDSHLPKDRFVALGDRPSPDPAALVQRVTRWSIFGRWMAWTVAAIFGIIALGALFQIITGSGGSAEQASVIVYGLFALAITVRLTSYRWAGPLMSWRRSLFR